MRKRIVSAVPLAFIGILFLLLITVWYKQFSFFNYSGEMMNMDDEQAAEYAEDADEREFALSDEYPQRIARVIFWTSEYSDIRIENSAELPVQVTMAGYFGDEVSSLPEAVVIEPDDELVIVADDTPGFVVTAYAADGNVSASDIRISHDNIAYMARWKKAVFAMLAAVAGCTGLCLLPLVIIKDNDKGRKAVACISITAGVLAFALAVICNIISLEPWADCMFSVFAAFCSIVALVYSVQKDSEKIKSPLYGGIAAATISFTIFFLLITSGIGMLPWAKLGETSSARILSFGMSFMIFVILYLVLGHISMRFALPKWTECFFTGRLSLAAGLLFLLALVHGHFGYEGQNVLIVLLLIALFVCGGRFIDSVKAVPDLVWYICYLIISVFYLFANIILNMWVDGYGMNHTDIYYNPVCMVAEGLPLQDIGLDCLYGHYALFYILPFKLFGANMKTIAVVTGISAGISVFFVLLSMHKLVEKTPVRIAGALLVLSSVTVQALYLQSFPCRMLFPFLLMYFILYCQKKEPVTGAKDRKAWGRYVCGYIICMLAILWNTETGLVCSLAWAVYCVVLGANGKKLISYFTRFALECVFILLELLGALFIWRLYNFFIVLKTADFGYAFRYGLLLAQKGDDFGGGYMSGTDNGVLHWQNEPWVYIMLLIMLLTVGLLAYSGVFDTQKDNKKIAGYLALLIILLGHFVYWLTRPEGYDIVLPALTLIVLVLYEKLSAADIKSKGAQAVLYVLICISLAKFSYQIPMSVGRNIQLIGSGIGNAEIYDKELEDFSRRVPKDCCTDGRGLRELYLDLGWDYRRAENIDISKESYIISESRKADFEGFVIIQEIPVGAHTYYLYENTSSK